MKVAANTDVAGQCHKRAKGSPLTQLHIVHTNNICGLYAPRLHSVLSQASRKLFTHGPVGNGQNRMAHACGLCQKLRISQQTLPIHSLRPKSIIHKYQALWRNTGLYQLLASQWHHATATPASAVNSEQIFQGRHLCAFRSFKYS